jgi:hypothetical protein
VQRGDVFRVRHAGETLDDHIHIVISDPDQDPDYIIAVNFTTWASYKDQSCIITRDEYAYLKEPRSCINYGDQGKVRVLTLEQYETLVAANLLRELPPVGDMVLSQIWTGGMNTEHWSEDNRALLQRQGFFEYEEDLEI